MSFMKWHIRCGPCGTSIGLISYLHEGQITQLVWKDNVLNEGCRQGQRELHVLAPQDFYQF